MSKLWSATVRIDYTFAAPDDVGVAREISDRIRENVNHEMDSSVAGDVIVSFGVTASKPKCQSIRGRALQRLAAQKDLFEGDRAAPAAEKAPAKGRRGRKPKGESTEPTGANAAPRARRGNSKGKAAPLALVPPPA